MRHTFSITKVDLNEGIAEANKRAQTRDDHYHMVVVPLAIDILKEWGVEGKGTKKQWDNARAEARKRLRADVTEQAIAREFNNLKA